MPFCNEPVFGSASGSDAAGNFREEVPGDPKAGKYSVIILTAKDTIDDKVEVLQSGADDYVTEAI